MSVEKMKVELERLDALKWDLKSAVEARKSADEALREELKALGVSAVSSSWSSLDPSRLYTKWY